MALFAWYGTSSVIAISCFISSLQGCCHLHTAQNRVCTAQGTACAHERVQFRVYGFQRPSSPGTKLCSNPPWLLHGNMHGPSGSELLADGPCESTGPGFGQTVALVWGRRPCSFCVVNHSDPASHSFHNDVPSTTMITTPLDGLCHCDTLLLRLGSFWAVVYPVKKVESSKLLMCLCARHNVHDKPMIQGECFRSYITVPL